jgi:hypothetical protein
VVSLTERVFDQCTRGRVNLLRLPEVKPLEIDARAAAEFDSMLDATDEGGWIEYRSSRPKHLFLRYVGERGRCLLHGSNDTGIAEFEPRAQETYTGELVEAVFATNDGIWVLFFAVVARPPVWSLRNACNAVPAGGATSSRSTPIPQRPSPGRMGPSTCSHPIPSSRPMTPNGSARLRCARGHGSR